MKITIIFLVCICCLANVCADTATVTLDGASAGRIFDGIGAVSAGASSRLLIDYPEPQRSHILDFLFKPNFGAGFQHLKVEVGGDTNSTDGCEPSHMHTRDDLNFERGYEWWLMKEAKKRNPDIVLDILPWGAPGWIGEGNFWSQDMADYMAKFVKGAKEVHGLDIDYVGIWNETYFNPDYIKMLRKTLDANGLKHVKIAASDNFKWAIVTKGILVDKELYDIVDVIADHYPQMTSLPEAQNCGKPLWSSEEGPWTGMWYSWVPFRKVEGLRIPLAKVYSRNYIGGRMTKSEVWSPITCYYNNLALPGSGCMMANTPWSGAYEVQPAIWITAHTTQFAKPGWQYLDDSCGYLPSGGSYVTLKAPNGKDWSLIIETLDAKFGDRVTFKLANGLSDKQVTVWRSSPQKQFEKLTSFTPYKGEFSFNIEADRVYSLTTTTGQQKGSYPIPARKPFPAPYSEDFESYKPGSTPKYWSDQGGIWEVVKRSDGNGKALRQVVPLKPILWGKRDPLPSTIAGDLAWSNYDVSADVLVENQGEARLYGRVGSVFSGARPHMAYCLKIDQGGVWTLTTDDKDLATGTVNASANTWHNLKLSFADNSIHAFIDGVQVADVKDDKFQGGMISVGCGGYTHAQFDNIKVNLRPGFVNLAYLRPARHSTAKDDNFYAPRITDGDFVWTRWNAALGKTEGQWVEVDLGKPVAFNTTVVKQHEERITGYKIQYWDGKKWADAFTGGKMPLYARDTFPTVTSNKLRLLVTSSNPEPSVYEVEVYKL